MMCRANGITHYENLANLEQVVGRRFLFIGLPLKVRGGTGSPVRAIAVSRRLRPARAARNGAPADVAVAAARREPRARSTGVPRSTDRSAASWTSMTSRASSAVTSTGRSRITSSKKRASRSPSARPRRDRRARRASTTSGTGRRPDAGVDGDLAVRVVDRDHPLGPHELDGRVAVVRVRLRDRAAGADGERGAVVHRDQDPLVVVVAGEALVHVAAGGLREHAHGLARVEAPEQEVDVVRRLHDRERQLRAAGDLAADRDRQVAADHAHDGLAERARRAGDLRP